MDMLAWVVPRDVLIDGALPLGCKALAPAGSALVTTGLPRSGCLGRVVGGGLRVHLHHVMVVEHGGTAGTDVALRVGLLMAQMHILEGAGALMEALGRKQALLRMQVLAGEEAFVRYHALSWDGVVIV